MNVESYVLCTMVNVLFKFRMSVRSQSSIHQDCGNLKCNVFIVLIAWTSNESQVNKTLTIVVEFPE